MSMTKESPRSEPLPGKQSKQDSAYQLIRGRIESGQYGPGQRLVIDRLAHALGISQVPIREAIRRLEAESWLHYELNAGPTVAPLNLERWSQLLESVAVIEGYATALAAPHLDVADLQKLEVINRRMRNALRESAITEFSVHNREFHTYILARCPNAVMVEHLKQSQAQLDSLNRAMFARERGVMWMLLGPKMGDIALADHEKLIASLRRGSPPSTIERLTRKHVLVHLKAAQKELARMPGRVQM
jgi:DNA-binding GntR family transcriptional regulator